MGVRASVQQAELNGWVPDENEFAWGLPGSLDPVGNFDPAGFAEGCSLNQMKTYREAELQHGRVAMLASVGFLVGEFYHPLFGLEGQEILAIDSLGEVRKVFPEFFEILTLAIGDAEEFATLHTKELQNGRLAMLAIAGFVAQELVDRTPILLEDFGVGVEADPSNPLF